MNEVLFLSRHRKLSNRARRTLVVWCKRIFDLPAVLSLLMNVSVCRHRGATIGRMTFLGGSVFLSKLNRLTIGAEVALGRCQIHLNSNVSIGNRVVMNDGVSLLTGTHDIESRNWKLPTKPIVIKDYAWLAVNAMVLPGVRIGRGAVVGANAVVRRDVAAYEVVVGNPAVPMGTQRRSDLSYSPTALYAPIEAWVGTQFVPARV
jgi:maltose O-acetyltransferase